MLWETGLLFRKTETKRRNYDDSPSSRHFEGSFLRKLSTYELSSCPPWLSRKHRLPWQRFLLVYREEISEKRPQKIGITCLEEVKECTKDPLGLCAVRVQRRLGYGTGHICLVCVRAHARDRALENSEVCESTFSFSFEVL